MLVVDQFCCCFISISYLVFLCSEGFSKVIVFPDQGIDGVKRVPDIFIGQNSLTN